MTDQLRGLARDMRRIGRRGRGDPESVAIDKMALLNRDPLRREEIEVISIEVITSEYQIAPSKSSRPLLAIGDVHGRANLLCGLVEYIGNTIQPDTRLVFLGDLIDPHPHRDESHDCAEVLDIAAAPVSGVTETIYLAGNHDAFLLIALHASRTGTPLPWDQSNWYNQGGAETAAAWGLLRSTNATPDEGALAAEIWSRMTNAQRCIFESMRVYVDHDVYLLVHAGFDPNIPLEPQQAYANILNYPTAQNEKSHPLWMRFKAGTDSAPKGRILIHGHTPSRRAFLGRRRICIDTGAKFGGPLTALEIIGDRMRLHQAYHRT
jgi:serine/threonine protein phosphatase 1